MHRADGQCEAVDRLSQRMQSKAHALRQAAAVDCDVACLRSSRSAPARWRVLELVHCTHVQVPREDTPHLHMRADTPIPSRGCKRARQHNAQKLCAAQSRCPLRRIICAMLHARSARPAHSKAVAHPCATKQHLCPPPTRVLRAARLQRATRSTPPPPGAPQKRTVVAARRVRCRARRRAREERRSLCP